MVYASVQGKVTLPVCLSEHLRFPEGYCLPYGDEYQHNF